jgi:uncharacterized protein (DUF697 family)
VGEFLGTLGASVAAGFVFREAARAAVKTVPFWGNAVSGVVAGAGTYAIGRAAITYFVDDSPIEETRRIFTVPCCRKDATPNNSHRKTPCLPPIQKPLRSEMPFPK